MIAALNADGQLGRLFIHHILLAAAVLCAAFAVLPSKHAGDEEADGVSNATEHGGNIVDG